MYFNINEYVNTILVNNIRSDLHNNRSEFHNNCKRLLNRLTKRGYNKTDTTTQTNRAITIPRNQLLNKIKTSNMAKHTFKILRCSHRKIFKVCLAIFPERLPLTVTYNRTLPGLKTIIDKNWHILQIEPKLKEIFAEPPILAFKRNKNLRDLIGVTKFLATKKF